jgi:hypothetical protein
MTAIRTCTASTVRMMDRSRRRSLEKGPEGAALVSTEREV